MRHLGTFAGLPPHRPPSYNEGEPGADDDADKPAWLQQQGPIDASGIDAFRMSHYADPGKWVAQWPKLPQYIANTKASIENGYPELTIPGAVRYQDTLGQQIGRALAGEMSVTAALAEAERQWKLITDELDPDLQAKFWKDQLEVWRRVGLAP